MPERKTAFREKQEILSYRIFHRCHCCHLHYRFWIANNISSSDINISAPMNDKLAVMLPDSSEVWLNAASQIRYHKSFLNNREILPGKRRSFL